MKFRYIAIIALLVLAFVVVPVSADSGIPTAAFTVDKTFGPVSNQFKFTDQSYGSPQIRNWKWEFQKVGDSTWTQFATIKNPPFTFPTVGTYSIRLTASNNNGGTTKTQTNYIIVGTPVVEFTGNPTSGTVPLTVQFTDQSTNSPTSWSWNFGDGNTATYTSPTNPSHQYTTTGSKTVTLTVSNIVGSTPLTKTSYITITPPAPTAEFSASPTSGYVHMSVKFSDESTNSPTIWNWEYRDSGTNTWTSFSTTKNPTYAFYTGTYDIRLTSSNADGGSGTPLEKPGYITVNDLPPWSGHFAGDNLKITVQENGDATVLFEYTLNDFEKWTFDHAPNKVTAIKNGLDLVLPSGATVDPSNIGPSKTMTQFYVQNFATVSESGGYKTWNTQAVDFTNAKSLLPSYISYIPGESFGDNDFKIGHITVIFPYSGHIYDETTQTYVDSYDEYYSSHINPLSYTHHT
jgi:PKD repeat protein